MELNCADGIDKNILKCLQRDGRLSQLELADEVGLSPTPCARRVKKLEADGYIRGYTALICEEKLGLDSVSSSQFALISRLMIGWSLLKRRSRAIRRWSTVG